MKARLLGILVVMLAAVLAMPPDGYAGTLLQGSSRQVSYGGVTFTYDTSLATDITAETVPKLVVSEAPYWEVLPEHLRFTFTGYPVRGRQPTIYAIPMRALEAMPTPEGVIGNGVEQLAALRELLAKRPDLRTTYSDFNRGPGRSEGSERVPYFPLINAAQIIATKMQYLSFSGGSGIRYVTTFAQDVHPIEDGEIYYTFLGLTNDGRFFVSAEDFPLTSGVLPGAWPGDEPQGGFEAHARYFQSTAEMLDQLPDSAYTPDLGLLDSMIRSLRVDGTVVPGMPRTGAQTGEHKATDPLLVAGMLLMAAGLIMGFSRRARRRAPHAR